MSITTGNECQQFKERKTIYGHLPPNIIAALTPRNLVHIKLIGSYSKTTRKQKPGGTITKKLLASPA